MEKYAEEKYARRLYGRLRRELALQLPAATASVSGEGCHWNCHAALGLRSCTIHCFDGPCYRPEPEFLASFEDGSARAMWGRISEQAEVIGAIGAWLNGQSIQELSSQFPFVDRNRRELETIQRETVEAQLELATLTAHELKMSEGCDGCALWFRSADRSCQVSSYTYAEFYWDECLQFRTEGANTLPFALLLKRWLCDKAMPSAIQREFPSVALSDVAEYYEQGRGIEGEFIRSWSHVEGFYKSIPRPFASQVLHFMSQLRIAGYERTLRAGTSLFHLLVSRSRHHGLRRGQPYIAFTFGDAPFNGDAIPAGQMEVALCFDTKERRVLFSSVELSEQLNDLLKQLERKAVD